MKRLGTGSCVVEEDGRYCRISQLNVRYDSGRGQRYASSTIGRVKRFAPSLGRRRMTKHLGIRVSFHRKKRSEKRKGIFPCNNEQWMYRSPQTGQRYCGTFTQRSERIAQGSGRNGVFKKMQSEEEDAQPLGSCNPMCAYHGQEARGCPPRVH